MEALLKRAVSGDPEAQYQLALFYLAGRDCPLSLAEGMRWLGSAATSHHAQAAAMLGQMRAVALQGLAEAQQPASDDL